MLVHAAPGTSGSLIRLINSLQQADYFGSKPSLTIELPHETDPALLVFLQNIKWEGITLRRQITPRLMTPEEVSIRTIESFYPRDPSTSHVLILSPQTDLSPSFFHYLKYVILRYKYSTHSMNDSTQLLGVSLELPSLSPVIGTPSPTEFPILDMPLFCWQAPNSNAALYFGDKWVEFHSFLSNRVASRTLFGDTPREKMISKRYPSFMEYLLEFIRARGYYMLYPSFPGRGVPGPAIVHNELYQRPQEFPLVESLGSEPGQPGTDDDDMILGAESMLSILYSPSTLTTLLSRISLDLPNMGSLSILSHDGKRLDGLATRREAEGFAKKFRVKVGRCAEADAQNVEERGEPGQLNTDDLFCFDA
jgi:hypothetical protein